MSEEEQARRNGLRALATVERVLTTIGWEPQRTEIDEVLMVDFEVDDIPISDAHFEVCVDYERFVCHFNFKDRIAPARENDALRFLAYANYDLPAATRGQRQRSANSSHVPDGAWCFPDKSTTRRRAYRETRQPRKWRNLKTVNRE